MATQLLKKMSAKSMIGNVKSLSNKTFYTEASLKKGEPKLSDDAPKDLDMFQIIGVADGIKTGSTDFGEWVSFEGTFKATGLIPDAETGEVDVFRSSRAFLPEPAASLLQSAMEEADTVELAFIVGIAPNDNAHGYEYICKPMFEPKENDAIAALEMKLEQQMKLEAPKKAPAKK